MIHDYFGINYEIVYDFIENNIPELFFAFNEIFNEDLI
jgi:uncharacterized protein with HEPN domain